MATKKAEVAEEVREELDPMRKVTIRLFKDSGKYKDDMIVGLNGRMYQIQRGKEVEVPWAVAEIIRESLEQDQATAELIMREEQNYHDNVERRLD
jgi:hypothetical protein